MLNVAFVDSATSPVSKVGRITWETLVDRLTKGKVGEKDGPAWLPSEIAVGPRNQERVKSISALVLDVERWKRQEKDDDGKPVKDENGAPVFLYGPDPAPPEIMQAEISLRGWKAVIHTSHSHTPEHPRYRLALELSRPLQPDELAPVCRYISGLLGVGDCVDKGCFEPARLFYLPRCPDLSTFWSGSTEGEALAVDSIMEGVRKAEAARNHRAQYPQLSGDVIGAFNEAHDVGTILTKNGYEPKGRTRWLRPGSSTGMPGLVLLPDSNPPKVFSHSADDALGDGNAHDAFDCFRILEHGGDMTEAVKAASGLLGMQQRGGSDGYVGTLPPHFEKNHGGAEAWPDPQPVPNALLPVKAFDLFLLPDSLRPWVQDIAARMQCPPDFTAVGAMVALSSVIGRKAVIRPKRKDDWSVAPNLWGAVVGRPGVMKSPALSEVMKPLDRLIAAAMEDHAEEIADYDIEVKLNEMQEKAAEDSARKLVKNGDNNKARDLLAGLAEGAQAKPPALRRYRVNQSSVEALHEILIENPWGVLVYRDELSGLLRDLDKEGQESARSFYLQAYDAMQPWVGDTISRGRNRASPAPCIALLGGIQPGRLLGYIREANSGGDGDDGLLQRIGMLVWPDISSDWLNIDEWPDSEAKDLAFKTFEHVDALPTGEDPETKEPIPAVYRFTEAAQVMFEEWRTPFETNLRNGKNPPAVESHFAKYRKLVPAIALVCALADGEEEVSEESLLRALAWIEYLQSHALRAYTAGGRVDTDAAAALLVKIKSGDIEDGFSLRSVYLKGWAGLNDPEAVTKGAHILCDLNCLRRIEVRHQQGGRPQITYSINPALLKG